MRVIIRAQQGFLSPPSVFGSHRATLDIGNTENEHLSDRHSVRHVL